VHVSLRGSQIIEEPDDDRHARRVRPVERREQGGGWVIETQADSGGRIQRVMTDGSVA